MQLTNIDEKIQQLNMRTFFIYVKTEKRFFATCTKNKEKIKKQLSLTDLTYLTMENRYTVILDNFIITSNLPINYDIV